MYLPQVIASFIDKWADMMCIAISCKFLHEWDAYCDYHICIILLGRYSQNAATWWRKKFSTAYSSQQSFKRKKHKETRPLEKKTCFQETRPQ